MASANDVFELLVIGGGSGGSAACKRAAEYLGPGKVCVIERGASYVEGVRKGSGVGGTCVNVGCVPKKLMYYAASVREVIKGGAEIATGYGFGEAASAVGDMKIDWAGLKGRRDAYIKRLNSVYESGWQKAGVTLHMGVAKLVDAEGEVKSVEVTAPDGSTTVLAAKKVVVAVGGEPSYPDIPGKEFGITSDGFFDLEEQPKKCAVYGAGYIAVEMAGILKALGTETDLFVRGSKPLRNDKVFDTDIVNTLMGEIEKHGPTLRANSEIAKAEQAGDGTYTITTKSGDVHTGYDCLLWAIGRHPVTTGMGLDALEKDRAGNIVVDEFENTSVPGILALGDCTTAGWELTPVAIAAGRRLGDRLFGGCPEARMIYRDIPTVIFSHPPIATIGYTEAAAREHFGNEDITVKVATFGSMIYAFNPEPEQKTKTTLKLVLQGEDELVVGLHMIGPFSDEMLQGFAVAVKMGCKHRDLQATCAIHPTIGEEMVTFGGWGQHKVGEKKGTPQLPPQLAPESDKEEVARLREEVAALKKALAEATK